MSDFDNTNSGALFKNDKQGNERRPDYKGTINVGGVEYWISSWIKKSQAGNTYMSLSVQQKEEVHKQGMDNTQQELQQAPQQRQQQQQQPQQYGQSSPSQQPIDDFNDDILF